ncbi:MAG: hypothetical protein B6I20_08885 [Bacteroidetes bacterium 4572_117]|nr:MAG: hypothetical protein B6I20_08885 [Bacteroidetes bacterium 4572_117]
MYGDVYYYKTNNNKEVDFFINKPDGPLLIQASYDFSNHDTQEREITSIVAAISELNLTKGYIYTYNTFDEIFIDEKKNKSFTFLESCFRIRSS